VESWRGEGGGELGRGRGEGEERAGRAGGERTGSYLTEPL